MRETRNAGAGSRQLPSRAENELRVSASRSRRRNLVGLNAGAQVGEFGLMEISGRSAGCEADQATCYRRRRCAEAWIEQDDQDGLGESPCVAGLIRPRNPPSRRFLRRAARRSRRRIWRGPAGQSGGSRMARRGGSWSVCLLGGEASNADQVPLLATRTDAGLLWSHRVRA